MFIERTLTGLLGRSAARMCKGKFGRSLGHPAKNRSATYYVVDGKVWLITPNRAVRLGSYFDYCDEVRRGIRAVVPCE
jgi:hypothetical protein